MPRASRRLLPLLLAVGAASCGPAAEQVRKVTYPANFDYLTRGEVRTEMEKLAVAVVKLDHYLRGAEGGNGIDRANVVAMLDQIDQAASSLDTGGSAHNHPVIAAGMPAFRRDIQAARKLAAQDPPNYYLAGAVAGACGYCHR